MSGQLSTHAAALRLFFTEDIYLVQEPIAWDAGLQVIVSEVTASAKAEDLPVRTDSIPVQQYDTFNSLGKNQKNILILVNDADHKVSTETGSELLRNIVKAINLSANDFALVNYAEYPGASYTQLSSFFCGKLVFCFGVSASDLQMEELPLNEINNLADARVILCANLKQLAEDQQSKKVLWGNLKKLNL
jgi:hypothetical protein